MGKVAILTRNPPAELGDIQKAEAYQIALLGGATGDQRVKEQHGWWNETEQRAEFLSTTFEPDTPLPFEEALKVYYDQIGLRASQGFMHVRYYSFIENRYVYEDLRKATGTCEYKSGSGGACGKPTNKVFPFGSRSYWFCDEHLKPGAEQVTGRPFIEKK